MRRTPIRFAAEILEDELGQESEPNQRSGVPAPNGDVSVVSLEGEGLEKDLEDVEPETDEQAERESDSLGRASGELPAVEAAGPVFAELLATRAELKRVQAEANELRDGAARRQADFENFRKRTERERSETYNRSVADLVAKLLPVLDNLRRAVDTEASVESTESDEFRHFLNGVDLIHKQLGGVLEALGVKPVAAVGEPFDPHVHEAVVTEATDEHEPDTVIQEIVRGYRLGDKLLRPALVKVAVKK
jgi:molecular chaperone GrpE